LGITRLNVQAGLSGAYLIRDDFEDTLGLPSGPYEIPLVLQDRILNTSGPAFFYPSEYDPEDLGPGRYRPLPQPSLVPEFFGDAAVVNGKAWPYLDVEPRAYRLRILNGSSSRFYRIRLLESDASGDTRGRAAPGPVLTQIGSDGGFLSAPVAVPRLLLATGERADVLVDFSANRGRHFVLWNDAVAPYPSGEPDSALTPLLLIHVRDGTPAPAGSLPRLEPVARLNENDRDAERDLTLSEDYDDYGRMRQRLGVLGQGPLWFHDPVTETPRRGSLEVWRFFNLSEDTHPVHLHLVQFQILSRQPIDKAQLPKVVFTGPAEAPPANEMGWKDVAQAPPGYLTRIIARFDAPQSWVYPGGQYMWHCHMLEHEDHDMMRPFRLRA
jgi:spore coat protein A